MTLTTEFRQAFVRGVASRGNEVADVVGGNYDLLIMTASWDARCLSLLSAELTATRGLGIFFANRGVLGLRDEHDPQVLAYLSESCKQYATIEGPSENLDVLWSQIWLGVSEAVAAVGRPIHVLLDLSTCPRYYALALFARGLRTGLLASVRCFYAEGEYPEVSDSTQEQFTAGRWETKHIPGLIGTADPGSDRLYVVSVGFEGSKTYRVVSNDDPDRVAVLFPDPGVKEEYVSRTRTNNQMLFDEFAIGADQTLKAPAGDAIAAWKALARAQVARPTDNPVYLCSGTKPHSLAMALHALIEERIAVLYAKPARHKEAQTTPLGVYWSYYVEDLTYPGTRNE